MGLLSSCSPMRARANCLPAAASNARAEASFVAPAAADGTDRAYLAAVAADDDAVADAATGRAIRVSEKLDETPIELKIRGDITPAARTREKLPDVVTKALEHFRLVDSVSGLFAIEGSGASGKSWILRAIAVRLARAQTEVVAGPLWLPLRLELATLEATTPINHAIETHEHKTALLRARDEHRIVLLLDGLEEVPDERRPAILEAVDDARTTAPSSSSRHDQAQPT